MHPIFSAETFALIQPKTWGADGLTGYKMVMKCALYTRLGSFDLSRMRYSHQPSG